MSEKNQKSSKKSRFAELMRNAPTNLRIRTCIRNPSRNPNPNTNTNTNTSRNPSANTNLNSNRHAHAHAHPNASRNPSRQSQSQSAMRKSVASSLSDKSGKSRASAASYRETRTRADSRATRTSVESRARSDNSHNTKSTKELRAKSTDSKSTFPHRKSSLTTLGGQSTARSSTSRSVTPGKFVSGRQSKDAASVPSMRTSTTQTRRFRQKGLFKGAPSAYSFFVRSYFSEFRRKNPNEKIPFITLSRRCADKWHSLPNPIKQEFYKMAQHVNARKLTLSHKPAHRMYPMYIRPRITSTVRSLTTTSRSGISRRTTSGDTTCSCSTRSAPKKRLRPRPLQANKYRRLFSLHSSTPGRHNRFHK